jgi:carboxylesterase
MAAVATEPDPRAPFAYAGDDRGVVLVHGFTGTPFEMSVLGARLAARGMTVTGVRLTGHGTTPEALERTPWTVWMDDIEIALADLAGRCRKVALVGQSLGGLLALHRAADRTAPPLAAIASLAAPLWLGPAARALIAACRAAPPLCGLVGPWPKRDGSDLADRAMKAKNPSYPVIPLGPLVELDRARATVRAELEHITAPLFLAHALHDHTAPYGSMAEIARRVSSAEVETLTLPRSFHVIALDLEREQLADALGRFLERHLSG